MQPKPNPQQQSVRQIAASSDVWRTKGNLLISTEKPTMLASPFLIQWWEQDLSQPRFLKHLAPRLLARLLEERKRCTTSHRETCQRHKTCPSLYWWTSRTRKCQELGLLCGWRSVAAASFVWKGDEAELKPAMLCANCTNSRRSFKTHYQLLREHPETPSSHDLFQITMTSGTVMGMKKQVQSWSVNLRSICFMGGPTDEYLFLANCHQMGANQVWLRRATIEPCYPSRNRKYVKLNAATVRIKCGYDRVYTSGSKKCSFYC